MKFRSVGLNDREKLTEILWSEPDRGCEYTFGNIYIWSKVYGTEIAWLNDTAVVRFPQWNNRALLPVGKDVESAVAGTLDAGVKAFMALRKEDCDALEKMFPEKFTFSPMKDAGEYVYNSDDLINLKGKKYHGKRNHISKYMSLYPGYTFGAIDETNIAEVRKMHSNWCKENGCAGDDGLEQESCAVRIAFEHFFELGFDGGYITDGERIVAFAMGEKITDSTYCVHIEKAYRDVEGAYTVINRDFAEHFCKDYQFINREDDAGEEGLRTAKLSYHPAYVTEKFIATVKE